MIKFPPKAALPIVLAGAKILDSVGLTEIPTSLDSLFFGEPAAYSRLDTNSPSLNLESKIEEIARKISESFGKKPTDKSFNPEFQKAPLIVLVPIDHELDSPEKILKSINAARKACGENFRYTVFYEGQVFEPKVESSLINNINSDYTPKEGIKLNKNPYFQVNIKFTAEELFENWTQIGEKVGLPSERFISLDDVNSSEFGAHFTVVQMLLDPIRDSLKIGEFRDGAGLSEKKGGFSPMLLALETAFKEMNQAAKRMGYPEADKLFEFKISDFAESLKSSHKNEEYLNKAQKALQFILGEVGLNVRTANWYKSISDKRFTEKDVLFVVTGEYHIKTNESIFPTTKGKDLKSLFKESSPYIIINPPR